VAVNKIDHAEACARALRLLLQTEEHEHVYVSHRQRRDATLQLEAFKRAPLGVLIGTTMLKEGIDLPGGIDVVVYAAAGESDQAMLQWDGRGLRPRAGKDHVVIYDSFDGTDPWGRRGSPSQDYLALHMRSRYDTYRRHKFAMIAPDVPEEELPHVFPPPDDSAAPRVAHPRRRLV
jgi:superfamily II DNA or RNA helicase